MSDDKNKKPAPNFADAAAAAKAAKAAKKAQSKKDRAAESPHLSKKPDFGTKSPMKSSQGFSPRVQSRAKKG